MKQPKNGCDLTTCYLCRHCSRDWNPAIAGHKRNIVVKKGARVFSEGDSVTGIYFIFSGKVKVHKRWDDDKEIILRFAAAGDILGHLGLGSDPVYPVSATAIEPTIVCYIDLSFFESSLNVNPKFTYSLMKLFANELQESEKRMRNLVHMPVKERIALALLTLQKQFGITGTGALNIEITRQDLSSFAAVSYETLFKVTNDFIQHNWITVNGKMINIIDEQSLKAITVDIKTGV
nr:Crp/Fnr family transcriptional regulator [uncultured Mucilaginibacter sp.]